MKLLKCINYIKILIFFLIITLDLEDETSNIVQDPLLNVEGLSDDTLGDVSR